MTDTKCDRCDGELPTYSGEHVERMSKIFQCLGDSGRLALVLNCEGGEKTVSELMESVGLSQSLTSHHLKSLKNLKVLKSRKEGRHQLYSLDDVHIKHIITDLMTHVVQGC